jgi:hypothetical protein
MATLSAAFFYLTAAPQAVENFRHVGYPQQLRVLLGIGKLAGAIVLLLPGLRGLKEWAYAGFTFMWIAAVVAHYLAGDGAVTVLPAVLLGALAVSYVTCSGEPRRFREGGGGVTGVSAGTDGAAAGGARTSRPRRERVGRGADRRHAGPGQSPHPLPHSAHPSVSPTLVTA